MASGICDVGGCRDAQERDRGRATLIGTNTFGKGTVQQWTQLEDDRGGFRLTIAKWLTPDRTWAICSGRSVGSGVKSTGDAISVQRAERFERLENDETQAAVEHFGHMLARYL